MCGAKAAVPICSTVIIIIVISRTVSEVLIVLDWQWNSVSETCYPEMLHRITLLLAY